MEKIINIGDKKEALKSLERYKKKRYNGVDIKIINVNLRQIVDKHNKKIFEKNDLYVLATTLYSAMNVYKSIYSGHNYHDLSTEEVYLALSTMKYSNDVSLCKLKRYKIVTLSITISGSPVIVIIEKNASL